LLAHPKLHGLLLVWQNWGDKDEVRRWCEDAIRFDDGLLNFLPKFSSFSALQTVGDWAVRKQIRLNPKWLEEFVDTSAIAQRLADLQQAGKVPEFARETVSQFLTEFEMISAGKNPDSRLEFED
jgi:hypothetical protein